MRHKEAATVSCAFALPHFRCCTYECHPLLISPIQRVRHVFSRLIKLTFWQQSILDDARLEQQAWQEQAEGDQDVHEGRRWSAMCPQGTQSAAARFLLEAILRRQGAAPLPGTGGQFDAVVRQVANLSSKSTEFEIIKM